ncbi:MAG TPA: NADH-quinone oxidoreductase subunit C [Thermoleophilaceae bacterium]|nr:NADH-quinone oxidoreductase subunit C [Thermoleophilaceae bacterium]
MPDATGLELIAQRVRSAVGDEAVTGTLFYREQATLEADPGSLREVLEYLRDRDEEPWPLLASLHGCDYLPDEPRLGVHYQLLSMERQDRLNVKTRLGVDDPRLPTVVDLFPTADFQEREVYDMFGVVFDGHPDLRRILMPEDYEGFPQRRDFPMGGEPVLYTYNEHKFPRWYD